MLSRAEVAAPENKGCVNRTSATGEHTCIPYALLCTNTDSHDLMTIFINIHVTVEGVKTSIS